MSQAAPPIDFEKLEEAGRKLIELERTLGSPKEVEATAKELQPLLMALTRRRLEQERLPLPEYLLTGFALEQTILDAVRQPDARTFRERFEAQLGVALEYARLVGMFVDRWLLQRQGASLRDQAAAAAAVEAIVELPKERREIPYLYIQQSMDPGSIARETARPVGDVRKQIAQMLKDARKRREKWLERWSPEQSAESTVHNSRRGGGGRKRS
ncbi:MAG: hypothetical protein JNJ88_03000 [Planctomycetes bacterium]|nr:hypothetical protein [Planctomycetota bacterium]